MKQCIIAILFLLLMNIHSAEAYVLYLREYARSEYENGKTSRENDGEFMFRLEVDEFKGTAQMTEYTTLRTNKVTEWAAQYTIQYVDMGKTHTSRLALPEKQNQKILCLLGTSTAMATEMFLVGDSFFEYCKGSSGRFYLSSGTAYKSGE